MGFYSEAGYNIQRGITQGVSSFATTAAGFKHFRNQQAQIDNTHLGNVEKLTADQQLNNLELKKQSEILSNAQEADKVADEKISSVENKISGLKSQYDYQKGEFDKNYAEYGRQDKIMKKYGNDDRYNDEYFEALEYRDAAAKARDVAKDKMNNIEKDIQSQYIARSDALTYKAGTAAQLKEAGEYNKRLEVRQDLLEKQLRREKSYLSKKALKEVNNGK